MKNLLVIIMVLLSLPIVAQVDYDDCFEAGFINDIRDYCSGPMMFTTVGAASSDVPDPVCWTGSQSDDVWISFAARNAGLFFQIAGATSNNDETMQGFSFALYEGRCTSLNPLLCGRSRDGINIIERTYEGLTIGRIYHLRIASNVGNAGTFELCMDSYNSVPAGEQDCREAVVLCDKESFVIDFLSGAGLDNNEADNTCLGGLGSSSETSSAWYKWTAATDGSLTFTLSPNNVDDPREDLDFVVFELPRGLDDCSSKEPIRCMASGETQGNTASQNAPCLGATGLREGANDEIENAGCSPGDDNFLAPIQMRAGRSYALLINNYSQSGFGFSISFGGTGEFLGPEPAFSVEADTEFECLLPIYFDDQSLDVSGDGIISYEWSFGEGAEPATGSGAGRKTVVYNSFGTKYVSLTVTSSKGCKVTEIQEIEIAPCCLPGSDLQLTADITDLSCYQSGDGQIIIGGLGGEPDYLYSLQGAGFKTNPRLRDLSAGIYTVAVQDAYGCVDMSTVTVTEPDPLTLTITGPTDSIGLGELTMLNSEAGPSDRVFSYQWSPPNGLSCTDCPDPELISSGSRVYTLTITDQDGCMTSAEYPFFSRISRNYYAPNILSTASTFGNHEFKIFTSISTEVIEEVAVYNRWGELMYLAENIVYNESVPGWDATHHGRPVNPGVYVWSARIRYLDDIAIQYAGTITVVK